MIEFTDLLPFIISAIASLSAILVSLAVHEWAHAFAAYKQGDPTAKTLGRMTLAPFAHIDWWGFICLLILGFGWAKPVPVDSRNFKNGKKSGFVVSIAGILANLITGTVFLLISCALDNFIPNYVTDWGLYGTALKMFLTNVVNINYVLAFFNLLPIYPLDGFRMIEAFANPNSKFIDFMRRYSRIILIVVIVFTIILDVYFSFTAYALKDLLQKAFNSLFGLMV